MKLQRGEFLAQPVKAVTLIGMSGVGKTYISEKLEKQGWTHYSCDYLIGTRFLRDAVAVSKEDIRNLSAFVGKVGDPAKGGLAPDEFRRRQQLYYDAECESLRHLPDAMKDAGAVNFINDSTGSLCEIRDEALLARTGALTLFVYIKASAAEEQEVLDRAQRYPKPMYFPSAGLDQWLAEFVSKCSVASANLVDPDDFARWVFPKLFAARLPKYQRLADLYGVTIPSDALKDVKSDRDFVDIVAGAL